MQIYANFYLPFETSLFGKCFFVSAPRMADDGGRLFRLIPAISDRCFVMRRTRQKLAEICVKCDTAPLKERNDLWNFVTLIISMLKII